MNLDDIRQRNNIIRDAKRFRKLVNLATISGEKRALATTIRQIDNATQINLTIEKGSK